MHGGATDQNYSVSNTTPNDSDDSSKLTKLNEFFSALDEAPSRDDLAKGFELFNEAVKTNLTDSELNEVTEKIKNLQDLVLLLESAEKLGSEEGLGVERVEKWEKLQKDFEEIKKSETLPKELIKSTENQIQKQSKSALTLVTQDAWNFATKLGGDFGAAVRAAVTPSSPSSVYGPPEPPKSYFDSDYGSYNLPGTLPRSTLDPVTKKWIPYQDTLEGMRDSSRGGSMSSSGGHSSNTESGLGLGSNSTEYSSPPSSSFNPKTNPESPPSSTALLGSATGPSPVTGGVGSSGAPIPASTGTPSGGTSGSTPGAIAGHGKVGGSNSPGTTSPSANATPRPSNVPELPSTGLEKSPPDAQLNLAKDIKKNEPKLLGALAPKTQTGLVEQTSPSTVGGAQATGTSLVAPQEIFESRKPQQGPRNYVYRDGDKGTGRAFKEDPAGASSASDKGKLDSSTPPTNSDFSSSGKNISEEPKPSSPQQTFKKAAVQLVSGSESTDLEGKAATESETQQPSNSIAKPTANVAKPEQGEKTTYEIQESLLKNKIDPFAAVDSKTPNVGFGQRTTPGPKRDLEVFAETSNGPVSETTSTDISQAPIKAGTAEVVTTKRGLASSKPISSIKTDSGSASGGLNNLKRQAQATLVNWTERFLKFLKE